MCMGKISFEEPTKIEADYSGGQIQTPLELDDLKERILDGEIIILKDVWEAEGLRELRNAIISWGESNPTRDVHVPYVEESFHRFDRNPDRTEHPRLFHTYCFYDAIKEEPPVDAAHRLIRPYIEGLHWLHTNLTGIEADLQFYPESPHYHPQVMHYPSGGGYFGMHQHQFEPNKIGVIGSMSERGVDYERGGTRFQRGNTTIDLEYHHDIGDIALFRYDLTHSVTPVDPADNLDWDSDDGRWSLLMPYHGRVWEGDQ